MPTGTRDKVLKRALEADRRLAKWREERRRSFPIALNKYAEQFAEHTPEIVVRTR